jgi:hypothetical protein
MIKTLSLLFLALASIGPMSAQEQLEKNILLHRYELQVDGGHLSGVGAEVLEKAILGAQFVLIGEQHGNAQTPEFASAVCDIAFSHGFSALAIEAGPMLTGQLEKWSRAADAGAHVAEFQKEFPDSIPFYRVREESAFLDHCAHSAKSGNFQLWGLDQEFYGESGFLLERLSNSHPGKAAAALLRRMLRENEQAFHRAVSSGNVKENFMFSVPAHEMVELRNAIAKEKNPAALAILNGFLESQEIYREQLNGEAYLSNRRRSVLMKTLFARNYERQTLAQGKLARVILKFGSAHLYKGVNPGHLNDLGNFVAEFADRLHSNSLHINVLAVQGGEVNFVTPGQSPQIEKFNLLDGKSPEVAFLKPLLDHRLPDGWTLYDLRGLRPDFKSLGPVDKELERLIFGYDIVVVVPAFTPSSPIL